MLRDPEGPSDRLIRIVDRGEHLSDCGYRQATYVDEGPDQFEPGEMLVAVVRLIRPGGYARRHQTLAQVVLDRRDRDFAAKSEMRDTHTDSVTIG